MHRRRAALLALLSLMLLRGCAGSGEEDAPAAQPSAGALAASGHGGAGVGASAGMGLAGAGGVAGEGGAAGKAGSSALGGSWPWMGGGPAAFKYPRDIPPGWEKIEPIPGCPLWVPGPNGALKPDPVSVPPIEWGDCIEPAPKDVVCKMMLQPWHTRYRLGVNDGSIVRDDKTGKTTLVFSRYDYNDEDRSKYLIVGDLQGEIEQAVYYRTQDGCLWYKSGVGGGHWAYETTAHNKESFSTHEVYGWIGASLEGTAKLLFGLQQPDPDNSSSWEAADIGLLRRQRKIYLTPWAGGEETLIHKGFDDEGEPVHLVSSAGDALFFEVGGIDVRGVLSWTAKEGTRGLVRYWGDHTQGAGAFGTDGKDMVWVHGTGKEPGENPYAKLDLMTAPFTTDALALSPRRLRADPGVSFASPYKVGCGHAAAKVALIGTDQERSLMIVRLSDGQTWWLDGGNTWGKMGWEPLAVTCDEVFAFASFGGAIPSTIVRIRLDSLGPGIPPD